MKYIKLFESHSDSPESICREYGIRNWTQNGDGTIDVDGEVFIGSSRILTKLPLKFGKVTGDFTIWKNKLITLEGCPREVGGYFNCSDQELTTLEGSPIEVGESFICSNNKLVSLEGAPREVVRSFGCSNNNLTTLEGAPIKVGENFYCSHNRLTSLKGSPIRVYGDFLCPNNELTSLEGGPIYVGESFDCDNNNLITLEGGPREFGEDFDLCCDYNPIWAVYKLFPDYNAFMDSLDYNYLRGKSIDKKRFEEALDEVGIKIPKKIKGWRWI